MNLVENNKRELTVDAEIEELERVLDFISEYISELGCSMALEMKINVACEEIFVNIAHYAYKKISPELHGKACISLSLDETGENIQIMFRDKGIAYNPLEKSDPDVSLSAEERDIGGLGIFMVKKSMDSVLYERDGDENVLVLVKNLRK
ncbi:MAG: ATP-binding protein [Oribacterium sp.]|nr:ATP-binding protein [Oribacterium sp.]